MSNSAASQATADNWRKGGNYIQLSDGLTHWRCEGPAGGEPIVLVHGATVPCWVFDQLVPLLIAAGFRTLRFDLYAHGSSDRPPGDYPFERFTRQVIELIEATNFPRPATLLGHSFGAALVSAVAAERPEWISRLVLVAPMLDFNSSTAWSRMFRYRGIGELTMRFIAVPALIRRRRLRYQRIGQPHLTQRFIEQVSYEGFARGLLSMFRTAALGDQGARYEALRRVDRRVLLITAEDDAILPVEHVARVRSLLPEHVHVSIAKAEHNLLLTHPDAILAAILKGSGDT